MNLVSVIVPTFNSANWISDTLDSVVAQTYPELELIIVDDGSSDNTVAIVREKLSNEFKHDWQIIELGVNRGPSAARNAGLRASRGSWIQFLDSDDFIASTKLELEMNCCATAPDDMVAVYSPWRQCHFNNGKITWAGPLARPNMDGKLPIMCLVGADRFLHAAGLARRSTLERINGFDESLRFWECEEINVRLAKAGRLKLVESDQPLYLWRLHPEKVYIGGENARYRLAPVALSWIELLLKAAGRRHLDRLGLLPVDRAEIVNSCTIWARRLYSKDRTAFRKFVIMARMLEPDFLPTMPKHVAILSRYVGYESAEAIGIAGALPNALLRMIFQRIRGRPFESIFD